jgi:hypothetical protein
MFTMNKWIDFKDVQKHGWTDQPLPPERRKVLCKIIGYWEDGKTPINENGGVVVGFLRYAAGDKSCPYFVCSAIPGKWEVVSWCDCIPDGFKVPGWSSAQGGRIQSAMLDI